jgi:hypothetical protein
LNGVSFYAFANDAAIEGTVPVPLHRLYNPTSDQHFYTTSDSEAAQAVQIAGFVVEKDAEVYVVPPDSTQFPDSVPLFRWLNTIPDPEF